MINNLYLGEDLCGAAGLDTVEVSRSAVKGEGDRRGGVRHFDKCPAQREGGGIDTWHVSRSGDHAPLGADGRRDLGRGRLRDRHLEHPAVAEDSTFVATASQLEVGPLPVRTEAPPL